MDNRHCFFFQLKGVALAFLFAIIRRLPGTDYTFDWRLITHPQDYSGEMEGKHSKTLKLSKVAKEVLGGEPMVVTAVGGFE